MEVRVLGDLTVVRGGVELDLGGPKPRAIIGLLVAADGRPVSPERLIDQLWGDDPPPKVVASLQTHVARLRRLLEPDRAPRTAAEVLVSRAAGYALVLAPDAVDANRFESAVRQTERATPEDVERLREQALALWRGPAYDGLREVPALAGEAVRLEEVRLATLEQHWAARIDRAAPAAVAELTALAFGHPVRERLWALLSLALYRDGRQAEALDVLRRLRTTLSKELGLDPGHEIRSLEEAVLRQDPGLLQPTTTSGPAPQAAAPADSAPGRSGAPASDSPTFAGREALLALAARLTREAASGTGRILLVTGQPGIGKTSFVAEVAAAAEQAGLRRAWGTWESEGCPPLWGWSEALAGLRVGAENPLRPGGDDSISNVFTQAAQILELTIRGAGTCLVLDDVQWADHDSLRLLGRYAKLVADTPVLLVVVCRDPIGEDAAPVRALLAALARLAPVRVSLAGLTATEIRAMVLGRTGRDVGDEVAERLQARTEGNAFFVHEVTRLLLEGGSLGDVDDPSWHAIPEGVRDVVRHRVAELPAAVGGVLATAAVIGRSFDLDVLGDACPDGEMLGEALDHAQAAGLVVDEGSGRCRFTHALVRDSIYDDLAPLVRSRVHAAVGAALERARVGHLDEHAAALADHYRLGGAAHARSAWTYAVRAASTASVRGAYADAARLLGSAIDQQATDPVLEDDERESTQVALGVARRQAGYVNDAWAPLASAAESALRRGDAVAAATALLKITEHLIWSWRPEQPPDEEAIDLWQRILRSLPADRQDLRTRCQVAIAVEALRDPSGGRCGPLVDEAVETARHSDDPDLLADVLQLAVNALQGPDLVLRRLAVTDELVQRCARRRQHRGLAVALCKRATDHSLFGRPGRALADFRRAHQLAVSQQLTPVTMVALLGLAVLEQAAGRFAESEALLLQAEAVQDSISMSGAGVGLAQRATASWAQNRMPELEPALAVAADHHPLLRELHLLAVVSDGRSVDVVGLAGEWSEQPDIPWDYAWLSTTVVRGMVWAEVGDPRAIVDLRQQLAPYAAWVADGAAASMFLGSVHHTLAVLARAAGDDKECDHHARAAAEMHERAGWSLWAERSRALVSLVAEGG